MNQASWTKGNDQSSGQRRCILPGLRKWHHLDTCAQHEPSTTWAFEIVLNDISLINNRTGAEVQFSKYPCCGKLHSAVNGNLTEGQNHSNNYLVTTDNSNRFRISTKFILVKVFVFIGLFSIVFNLVREVRGGTISEKSVIGLTLGTIALIAIFYFVNTRKRIDYDDIKQTLYVVDSKNQTEIEIPVGNIDKILYSSLGGRGTGSYVIVYRDFHNQQQKARLFPIPFDNTIDTIKTDAQLKNPDLVTRNWSVGWNELFD